MTFIDWLWKFVTDLLDRTPQIIALILFIALIAKPQRLYRFIDRIETFKAGGVELKLTAAAKDLMAAGEEQAEERKKSMTLQKTAAFVPMSDKDADRAVRRAQRNAALLKGKLILWIDDLPPNNLHERDAFSRLGLRVEQVRSGQEAEKFLSDENETPDLILSDISRGKDPEVKDAGFTHFNEVLRLKWPKIPVIFYVTVYEPERGAPPFSAGIAARPDELLHLVIDALERRA